MKKRKLVVYQQTKDNSMSCIENVIYSYIYFRVVRFARQNGLTTRQISKGTGIDRVQTVATVLKRLEASGVVYQEEKRWLVNGVPEGWYRKRKDGKRMFMMVLVPKQNTLTLKQNLVYWKLVDLQRIYKTVNCIGGVWDCGNKSYRPSGIAKILKIDKATVLRSAKTLAKMGLLDSNWNVIPSPPDLWRDSSCTVEAKPKPEAKKVKARTYQHPEMQSKWNALLEAAIPFDLAEKIADLDFFVSIEVGDLADLLRSAERLTRRNIETGATSVNHPGYLVLHEMEKRNNVYQENQRRYAGMAVA